jgi:mannose-6-phosphate isomerase-like protein (cupin superfamily)
MLHTQLRDIASIKRAWALRGFSLFLWRDPPGKSWPPIIHDLDEVVILLEGSLTFGTPTGYVNLEQGKELLIQAGWKHTVHNTGTTTNTWCYGYRVAEPQSNSKYAEQIE